ncbi:hypothetical protein Hanom_Chr11g00996811 [Helianthus anomalus]
MFKYICVSKCVYIYRSVRIMYNLYLCIYICVCTYMFIYVCMYIDICICILIKIIIRAEPSRADLCSCLARLQTEPSRAARLQPSDKSNEHFPSSFRTSVERATSERRAASDLNGPIR